MADPRTPESITLTADEAWFLLRTLDELAAITDPMTVEVAQLWEAFHLVIDKLL